LTPPRGRDGRSYAGHNATPVGAAVPAANQAREAPPTASRPGRPLPRGAQCNSRRSGGPRRESGA
jgi:hypothetical protein